MTFDSIIEMRLSHLMHNRLKETPEWDDIIVPEKKSTATYYLSFSRAPGTVTLCTEGEIFMLTCFIAL
jgi:hypothetical protein